MKLSTISETRSNAEKSAVLKQIMTTFLPYLRDAVEGLHKTVVNLDGVKIKVSLVIKIGDEGASGIGGGFSFKRVFFVRRHSVGLMVVIPSDAVLSELYTQVRAAFAHEFKHVMQFKHNVRDGHDPEYFKDYKGIGRLKGNDAKALEYFTQPAELSAFNAQSKILGRAQGIDRSDWVADMLRDAIKNPMMADQAIDTYEAWRENLRGKDKNTRYLDELLYAIQMRKERLGV